MTMSTQHLLCALDTIADGGACVVDAPLASGDTPVVLVRRGVRVWGYLNRCPHFSLRMDHRAGHINTYKGQVLMCAHHSALFRFEDGHCIEGPCAGATLTPVPVRVVGDAVHLTDQEPRPNTSLEGP
ncbi:Rieske (2Fe-2S) protein [Lysobacter sp.]|uniref:Rieske (2Fe-2S) protein n=1 Tax=Lysobacter sp. TaxID=72226 RepID=UPI002D2F8A91|nr:Rieske 2Fe-2S domain-containing protein [Lysobacter sp.]HZX77305.1 Rieske 2Fe-2S domain-containing protein [Lysobacter sp.]